jgi:hypothetical protein
MNLNYNSGTIIQSGGQRPPIPLMTQRDMNVQKKNILFNNEKYVDEKNSDTFSSFPGVLHQRPMTIVNPTYDQYIIKPPKENVTHGSIPDIEIISSYDRNYTLYPNPSSYIIKLKDIYKDVTSVTLFNANIPNTSYIIDSRNNLIYFKESLCQQLIAEVPYGDYDKDTLVKSIEDVLNKIGDSQYKVEIDKLTNKIKICSNLAGGDNIFSLDFHGFSELHDTRTRATYPNRSIGKVLGFSRKNVLYAEGKAIITSGNSTIIGTSKSSFFTDFTVGDKFYVKECDQLFTVIDIKCHDELTVQPTPCCNVKQALMALSCHKAQNKIYLNPEPFIILNILELENVRSNSTPIDRAFAIIPMSCSHNSTNYMTNVCGTDSYIKYFNPPLARLDRLTVQFKDLEGNIVDFQGIDNYLEFRITSLNNPGHYIPGSVN